jgi:hypothetical protein
VSDLLQWTDGRPPTEIITVPSTGDVVTDGQDQFDILIQAGRNDIIGQPERVAILSHDAGVQGPQGAQGPQGVQGPAGPAGGDLTYTHVQGSPATTWSITHNLNKYPAVSVVDSTDRVVDGEVQYLSLNTLQLLFTAGFSGKAYLN